MIIILAPYLSWIFGDSLIYPVFLKCKGWYLYSRSGGVTMLQNTFNSNKLLPNLKLMPQVSEAAGVVGSG